jgi:membrane protein implicated in regulation of membrane protease activity
MYGVGPAVAWLIAALVLGIAELAVPGVFLVFLAIAAAFTGVMALAFPDLPVAVQLVAWSVVAVTIGKRWYRDYPVEGGDPLLNDRAARLIGQIVIVETALVGGQGRVLVGDGSWPARGPDAAVGTRVRIVAVMDGAVAVEPQ